MERAKYTIQLMNKRIDVMTNFILTILIGTLFGYIFLKLKVPGGMMVGSIIAVSILNITTGMAYMPATGRVISQIIAGAFIGVGIERSDLVRLKYILKPAIILLLGLLILNITSGFLIYFTSPLDLMTSLMSAVPGGMTDIPIISEEMGADSSKVAVLQFIRLIFGIGVFPSMISKVSNLKQYQDEEETEGYKRTTTNTKGTSYLILTIIVASIFGTIGKLSNIPSATLVFSMFSVIVLKLKTEKACMPTWMRRFAQVLAGAYIGSSMEMNEIMEMKYLIVPAIILILGYLITCYLIGNLLHKRFNLLMKEGMLAATPAGASDMALISADIGIESADVIVLQIIRMVTAVSIFPQIIRLIITLIGK